MKNVTAFLFISTLYFLVFRYTATAQNTNSNTNAPSQSAKSFATCNIQAYKDKDYIFDANTLISECTSTGENLGKAPIVAEQGYLFNVYHVDNSSCALTVQFIDFTDAAKAKIFNDKYFLLTKIDMDNSCSEDIEEPMWDISFGTLITPFKFRPTKSLFTSNLNLGSSINFQRKISDDWKGGLVLGISLSSVTLDSLSTNNRVKTNTDRPALTPSLSLIFSYKSNIFLTFGTGVDYINRTSIVEQSWIFNSKPWIGFGIGINLFTATSSTPNKTQATGDQKK